MKQENELNELLKAIKEATRVYVHSGGLTVRVGKKAIRLAIELVDIVPEWRCVPGFGDDFLVIKG